MNLIKWLSSRVIEIAHASKMLGDILRSRLHSEMTFTPGIFYYLFKGGVASQYDIGGQTRGSTRVKP